MAEGLDELEFSKPGTLEKYLMNRVQGQPIFDEDQSILDAAAEYAAKDAEKKAKREKMDQNMNQKAATNQGGKKQPILKITKGKLGTKTKKKDLDDEDAMNAKNKQQTREIRGMEEMHWAVSFILQEIKTLSYKLDMDIELGNQKLEQKKGEDKKESAKIYDIIYEPFELYTDARKRYQIELVKGVIFQLKMDFNEEFKDLESFKQDRVMDI